MNDISSYQDDSSVFDEDIFSDEEVVDGITVGGGALAGATTDSFKSNAASNERIVSNQQLENAMDLIDSELIRLASREVLPAHEVRDLLLDLRLQLVGAIGNNNSGS